MKTKKQKLYRYFLITGLSIVIGLVSYSFHKTDDFKLFYKQKVRLEENTEKNNDIIQEVSQITTFSYEQIRFFNDNNLAIFIDARSGYEIESDKIDELNTMIPDSKWIPVEDIDLMNDEGYFEDSADLDMIKLDFEKEFQTIQELQTYPKNLTYIVYCGYEDCNKSENLYQYMTQDFNFENVYIYKGGWEEWKNNQ